MKILVRGIPNFTYTTSHKVPDLVAFLHSYSLKISEAVNLRTDYFYGRPKNRVSIYVEGAEANRNILEQHCRPQGPPPQLLRGHPPSCVITVQQDGCVSSAGTTRTFTLGVGNWYMVEPTTDPRYLTLLQEFRANQQAAAKLEAARQEKEDRLLEAILERAEKLGYAEALHRLNT